MDRLDAMRGYLKSYRTKRVREKITEIKGCAKETLLPHVDTLLQESLNIQKNQLWKPASLCLLHLLSSIVTGSHEYELLLADEQIYLDKHKIETVWKADFFYQDEKEAVKKELQKQFVNVSDYEVTYAEHWIQYEYRKLLEVYWQHKLGEIVKLETFKKLNKQTPFQFICGDYMGTIKIVSQVEGKEL